MRGVVLLGVMIFRLSAEAEGTILWVKAAEQTAEWVGVLFVLLFGVHQKYKI